MKRNLFTTAALLTFVVACAEVGTPPPITAPVVKPMASTTDMHKHPAHALLVEAASCWFGGMWGDAEGLTGANREATSTVRCEDLVQTVYGSDDHEAFLRVRAFEPGALKDVSAKIASLADKDPEDAPRKDALVKLFNALAAAEEETSFARRAAYFILHDFDHEPEMLDTDESKALPELERAKAFAALGSLDLGGSDLQKEAHALFLFVALERMGIAQMIPLHLKPYPVSQPLHLVFGVQAPMLAHDSAVPLEPGSWLRYLKTTAAAAGHPVTRSGSTQLEHALAVGGVLAGIADKLRADAAGFQNDSPLLHIVHVVAGHLEQHAADAQGRPPTP